MKEKRCITSLFFAGLVMCLYPCVCMCECPLFSPLSLEATDPNALKPSIVPGLSNLQLMFVGYAQGWCAVQSAAYLQEQVRSSAHKRERERERSEPHLYVLP